MRNLKRIDLAIIVFLMVAKIYLIVVILAIVISTAGKRQEAAQMTHFERFEAYMEAESIEYTDAMCEYVWEKTAKN